jgi:hypothetical protein
MGEVETAQLMLLPPKKKPVLKFIICLWVSVVLAFCFYGGLQFFLQMQPSIASHKVNSLVIKPLSMHSPITLLSWSVTRMDKVTAPKYDGTFAEYNDVVKDIFDSNTWGC